MEDHFPCHSCGTMTHLDDLDAKDDGTGNFTILECEKCYGEGYAPLFDKNNPPIQLRGTKKDTTMKKNKGCATFSILRDDDRNSTGYSVSIFKDGLCVEEYSGGDSEFDSQVYGTGEINEGRLREMAQTTAEEMLKEHNLEGEISESEDSE